MSLIHASTTLFTVDKWLILRLPDEASRQLSSRNIAMVQGAINGYAFESVLEPDGNGSHWLDVDKKLQKVLGLKAGDSVDIVFEATKNWIEPDLPKDITTALAHDKKASETWAKTTPMARWEWVRWVRATNNVETRARRIEVACSKLRSGMRRPCCFNTSACTVPEISKNGALLTSQ